MKNWKILTHNRVWDTWLRADNNNKNKNNSEKLSIKSTKMELKQVERIEQERSGNVLVFWFWLEIGTIIRAHVICLHVSLLLLLPLFCCWCWCWRCVGRRDMLIFVLYYKVCKASERRQLRLKTCMILKTKWWSSDDDNEKEPTTTTEKVETVTQTHTER